MTEWTAADLPAFSGRTVIVTGANSGLGLVTARELARVGAKTILAVRNTAKGDEAAATITGDVEVRKLDLQDLASVRAFADGVDGADVLISDIGMPEEDGYELLRKIRSMEGAMRATPAIALTAFARPEDRRRALLAGFQMHLAKPIDPVELTVVVANLAGRTSHS